MLQTKRQINDKIERETRFYITSSTDPAQTLADVVRRQWAVESMRWLMDRLFRDEQCRVQTQNAPANFTTVKHIAHNLLRRHPAKISMTHKRLKAGSNEQFLINLIA